MSARPSQDIASIIRDGTAIDRAIVAARRRVVEVAPESVELPDDTTTGTVEL